MSNFDLGMLGFFIIVIEIQLMVLNQRQKEIKRSMKKLEGGPDIT